MSAEREVLFIVARADNGCIARDGQVPWAIPEDLRRFKRLTLGKPMIMGRKTFDSLPGLLPDRRHIVLTRDRDWQADGAEVAHSAEDAIALAGASDFSVIGGAQVFALLADHATRWEVTAVHESVEGEVFLPDPAHAGWIEQGREARPAGEKWPAFDFVTLRRPGDSA